ncbi:MAG: type II secretion system F family protein [Candidatus Omnitrophica bacterium]|nr:type II secretion system F family protein [Candidatus Omnitrophota bacterium]
MFVIISLIIFAAVTLFAYFGVPLIAQTIVEVNTRRARDFAQKMDRAMLTTDIRKVSILYMIGPFILGGGAFVVAPDEIRLPATLAGFVVGFIVPKTYANMLMQKRRKQFGDQLIDALMIMSSSFRGGLSLIQSMEAVVDEMNDPIKQEIGLVLGENKMGVSLDEAMNRLYRRMPSPALQQMISAILLARETGGNLPIIFSRIVYTIRERKKIEENINMLTIQGRLQALVMSGLPIGFFFMVNSSNPRYFQLMITQPDGRIMLMVAAGLWLIGTFFILKISAFKDF